MTRAAKIFGGTVPLNNDLQTSKINNSFLIAIRPKLIQREVNLSASFS